MKPALIDIGVNLTHRSFERDRDAVIRKAQATGVEKMVLTGTSEKQSRAASKLAKNYPGVLYATAGVHPHNASEFNENVRKTIVQLAAEKQVVAIGECGLDYNRDFSPRQKQLAAFEQQLEIAAELQLPVFLHERDAAGPFTEMLKTWRPELKTAVVHCFTGNAEALHGYLDLDLHIGITGWICDERRGLHLRKLVKDIPLNRLMIETDAPFLTPRNISPKPKSRRNEPAYLVYVLEAVSKCLQLPTNEVAAQTTNTASAFFGFSD